MNLKLLLFSALLMFGISACKEKETPVKRECSTEGTVRNAGCASGIWKNLWIQLDDGTWLQPWESDIRITVEEGDRLKFGYTLVTRDQRHENEVICAALPPPGNAIKITCVEKIGSPRCPPNKTCELEGVVKDYTGLDGCGWVIEEVSGKKYEVNEFHDRSFVPVNGQRITFGIIPLDMMSICMVGEKVDVSCIQVMENSGNKRGRLHFDADCQVWTVCSSDAIYEIMNIRNIAYHFTEGQEITFDFIFLHTLNVTCTTHSAIEITSYQAAK